MVKKNCYPENFLGCSQELRRVWQPAVAEHCLMISVMYRRYPVMTSSSGIISISSCIPSMSSSWRRRLLAASMMCIAEFFDSILFTFLMYRRRSSISEPISIWAGAEIALTLIPGDVFCDKTRGLYDKIFMLS